MPFIREPDDPMNDEIIKIGVMAVLRLLHYTADSMGHKGMCPVCGAPDCSVLYQATRGYDAIRDEQIRVIIGCDKCVEPIDPFQHCFNLMLDACDVGNDEYKARYEQDHPKEETPGEDHPKEGSDSTLSVIDALIGKKGSISNF